jgi:hypothetical protein
MPNLLRQTFCKNHPLLLSLPQLLLLLPCMVLACCSAPHLCWADCLAELARDAALLPGGVPAQHVLAAEAVADGSLLKGVVDLQEKKKRVCRSV